MSKIDKLQGGFGLAEMAERKKEGSSGVELVDLKLVQLDLRRASAMRVGLRLAVSEGRELQSRHHPPQLRKPAAKLRVSGIRDI